MVLVSCSSHSHQAKLIPEEEEAKAINLLDLPGDILRHIFFSLDAPSVYAMAFSCKHLSAFKLSYLGNGQVRLVVFPCIGLFRIKPSKTTTQECHFGASQTQHTIHDGTCVVQPFSRFKLILKYKLKSNWW